MTDAEAILRWLVALTVVSYALLPLACWMGLGLGSAVLGLVRPLGVVVLTAALWWPAAVLAIPFNASMLIVVCLILGLVSWTLYLRAGLRVEWQPLLAFEALWLFLFSMYAFFRSYNPDIANTEKPMEIALLSSISRSTNVPAPDPWFAGEAINYYYFGYQMIASLVKLSGVPPSIAFNLALATLCASVGTVAAIIGYRLALAAGARTALALTSAAGALFAVLLAGNLEAAWRVVQSPSETFARGWWYDGVGWQASRIIVDTGVHGSPDPRNTINEFPAFSFVLGDLHPHVLTYPLLLTIVALVVGLLLAPASATIARTTTTGGLIGLLYVSNSWDAPLGALLVAIAVLTTVGWRTRSAWLQLASAGVAALAVALPFVLHFTAPVGLSQSDLPAGLGSAPVLGRIGSTLGIVTWRPSSVAELLIVHGHWIVAFGLFAAMVLAREQDVRNRMRAMAMYAGIVGVLVVLFSAVWVPGLLLLGAPLAVSVCIACTTVQPITRVVAWLFAVGFLLTVVPEFIYIQDVFGDRMNTVFKLYFQGWALLALATAGTVALALTDSRSKVSQVSLATLFALTLLASPYLPISARDWTDGFNTRYALDGAAYIERNNPDDAAALSWLNENSADNAILVEGPGCSYQPVAGAPTSRFSAFSGLPTIVGWAGHERQWRRGEDDFVLDPSTGYDRANQRQDFANSWLGGDPMQLPDIPEPDFIMLGSQERLGSTSCEVLQVQDVTAALQALESEGWEVVFQAGETRILAQQ